MNSIENKVMVTGMGAITPIGIGIPSFSRALKRGGTNFTTLSFKQGETIFKYPIGQVDNFNFKDELKKLDLSSDLNIKAERLRNIFDSNAYGVYCALEAWKDAKFVDVDVTKVAIISSGSNTQQSSLQQIQYKYTDKLQFLNPNYGFNFFDTDIVGTLSEIIGVKGEGYSVGAASASGNMGIIQGARLIQNNMYDVVIVVAPLMDISKYEYQGFTAIGGMASINEYSEPSDIYRPFDTKHNGFVYGQSAGCLVLESKRHSEKRGKVAYGSIEGYGICMDANRNPNPSIEGEKRAMKLAIDNAGIRIDEIDYVNTHGSGSVVGDKTEVKALLSLGLEGIKANSTKSLIGHGLSAAGTLEAIASFIQMKEKFLHKSVNLTEPINHQIDWTKNTIQDVDINYTLSNSFGFGGVNTSIIFKK